MPGYLSPAITGESNMAECSLKEFSAIANKNYIWIWRIKKEFQEIGVLENRYGRWVVSDIQAGLKYLETRPETRGRPRK
jgi:hypothetical protein